MTNLNNVKSLILNHKKITDISTASLVLPTSDSTSTLSSNVLLTEKSLADTYTTDTLLFTKENVHSTKNIIKTTQTLSKIYCHNGTLPNNYDDKYIYSYVKTKYHNNKFIIEDLSNINYYRSTIYINQNTKLIHMYISELNSCDIYQNKDNTFTLKSDSDYYRINPNSNNIIQCKNNQDEYVDYINFEISDNHIIITRDYSHDGTLKNYIDIIISNENTYNIKMVPFNSNTVIDFNDMICGPIENNGYAKFSREIENVDYFENNQANDNGEYKFALTNENKVIVYKSYNMITYSYDNIDVNNKLLTTNALNDSYIDNTLLFAKTLTNDEYNVSNTNKYIKYYDEQQTNYSLNEDSYIITPNNTYEKINNIVISPSAYGHNWSVYDNIFFNNGNMELMLDLNNNDGMNWILSYDDNNTRFDILQYNIVNNIVTGRNSQDDYIEINPTIIDDEYYFEFINNNNVKYGLYGTFNNNIISGIELCINDIKFYNISFDIKTDENNKKHVDNIKYKIFNVLNTNTNEGFYMKYNKKLIGYEKYTDFINANETDSILSYNKKYEYEGHKISESINIYREYDNNNVVIKNNKIDESIKDKLLTTNALENSYISNTLQFSDKLLIDNSESIENKKYKITETSSNINCYHYSDYDQTWDKTTIYSTIDAGIKIIDNEKIFIVKDEPNKNEDWRVSSIIKTNLISTVIDIKNNEYSFEIIINDNNITITKSEPENEFTVSDNIIKRNDNDYMKIIISNNEIQLLVYDTEAYSDYMWIKKEDENTYYLKSQSIGTISPVQFNNMPCGSDENNGFAKFKLENIEVVDYLNEDSFNADGNEYSFNIIGHSYHRFLYESGTKTKYASTNNITSDYTEIPHKLITTDSLNNAYVYSSIDFEKDKSKLVTVNALKNVIPDLNDVPIKLNDMLINNCYYGEIVKDVDISKFDFYNCNKNSIDFNFKIDKNNTNDILMYDIANNEFITRLTNRAADINNLEVSNIDTVEYLSSTIIQEKYYGFAFTVCEISSDIYLSIGGTQLDAIRHNIKFAIPTDLEGNVIYDLVSTNKKLKAFIAKYININDENIIIFYNWLYSTSVIEHIDNITFNSDKLIIGNIIHFESPESVPITYNIHLNDEALIEDILYSQDNLTLNKVDEVFELTAQ